MSNSKKDTKGVEATPATEPRAIAETSPTEPTETVESTETEKAAPRKKPERRRETAETMAARQKSISVSEFFSKNRHLLGFDNPRKALLTAIKEAVDNALDACEEAGILPDLIVELTDMGGDRFNMAVEDNGPGIMKRQIPNIFGKLLYGSKFHRLKMSRGQQGIGISAAGMYGLITTGRPVHITSRTSKRAPAHHFQLQIDTKQNKPEIIMDEEVEWEKSHGTRVEIFLEGSFKRGRQSVDEYLRQTAIANPHISLFYRSPDGSETMYDRSTEELPPETKEIQPHPRGVELGIMQGMLKDTKAKRLSLFLETEFSRVSHKVALEICEHANLSHKAYPIRISRGEVEHLMEGIAQTKILNPPTNCVAPIGEEQLMKGLSSVVDGEFSTSCTRPPAVYRGNPFIIEAALVYGGSNQTDGPARLIRFANRVPLLYQQGGCCTFNATTSVNWRNYGIQQPKGSLPVGPITIVVHMASVWVPFTSESKEAIASYPAVQEEVTKALQECGRKLKIHLSRKKKELEFHRKRDYIDTYIPHIGYGLRDLIDLEKKDVEEIVSTLTDLLERRPS
jgi:DNA topoisomerase-6 subunit B